MGRPLLVLFLVLAAPILAEPPTLELDADPASPTFGTVEATGLDEALLAELRRLEPAELDRRLVVTTGDGPPPADRPAMLGTVVVERDRLRFRPRFPLDQGQPYFVRLQGDDGQPLAETTIALPAPERDPTTVVDAIHPSGDELPENLLRLYIHFSAPMSRGEAFEHLRLHRVGDGGDDEAIPFPFVAPEHELWTPETDRLTVFLDPGRIKRGVGPNEAVGPPLRAGETYRLVIDAAWRDARGEPLVRTFEKRFRVSAPDRTSPSADAWAVTPPKGSEAPLTVTFREPLDHALLERLLIVVDAAGEPVDGTVRVHAGETVWSFHPAVAWRPGPHKLLIATALEDPSGNSLRRPFESAVTGRLPPATGPEILEMPFEVSPGPGEPVH